MGIKNSGTISAAAFGILLSGVSAFSGNVSNSGTIVGQTGIKIDQGVTFAAGSAIVNSGAIAGTGGTAIGRQRGDKPGHRRHQNGGTITGKMLLATVADVLNVAGGGIAGNIVGVGSLDTINFNLGTGNTFHLCRQLHRHRDVVNINSGTAVFNGTSNSATTVNVNSGGTLAGTGSIDPAMTIFSGGILAPGTPGIAGGTLHITGSVAFEPGSYYQIAINPTQNSQATVNGTVTINGGTVVLVPVTGLGTHYAARTDFTILTFKYVDRRVRSDRDLWRLGETEQHGDRDRGLRQRRSRCVLRGLARPVVAAIERHRQRTERRQRHQYRRGSSTATPCLLGLPTSAICPAPRFSMPLNQLRR